MKKIIIVIVVIILIILGIGTYIFVRHNSNTVNNVSKQTTISKNVEKSTSDKGKGDTIKADNTNSSNSIVKTSNSNSSSSNNITNTNTTTAINKSNNSTQAVASSTNTNSNGENTILTQQAYNNINSRFEKEVDAVVKKYSNNSNVDEITSKYLSTHFTPIAATNMSNVSMDDLNNGNYSFSYIKNNQGATSSNPNKMPFEIPLNIYNSSLNGYLVFTIVS
ncbi:MAG: hypothetical protein ACRDAU_05970 [Clostridium sp.]